MGSGGVRMCVTGYENKIKQVGRSKGEGWEDVLHIPTRRSVCPNKQVLQKIICRGGAPEKDLCPNNDLQLNLNIS